MPQQIKTRTRVISLICSNNLRLNCAACGLKLTCVFKTEAPISRSGLFCNAFLSSCRGYPSRNYFQEDFAWRNEARHKTQRSYLDNIILSLVGPAIWKSKRHDTTLKNSLTKWNSWEFILCGLFFNLFDLRAPMDCSTQKRIMDTSGPGLFWGVATKLWVLGK